MTVWQVNLKYRQFNQEFRNVFYYEPDAADPTAAEWASVAETIRTNLVTHWFPHCSNTVQYYGIDVRRVDVADLPTTPYTPASGPAFGANVVDPVATQVALMVRVQGTTTKPRRGRTYLPGASEGAVINSLFIASVQTGGVGFVNSMGSLPYGAGPLLIRQSVQWDAGRTMVVAHNSVATAIGIASEVPTTIRRRRIGVGI